MSNRRLVIMSVQALVLATAAVCTRDAFAQCQYELTSIRQMRGPCNAILPKKTQSEIEHWVRQKDRWHLPTPEIPAFEDCSALDDDLPF